MSAGLVGWIEDQVARFRERAGLFATYGALEASKTLERVAEDLETNFREWWLEELSVQAAAAEAGYSAERLRELVREGRVQGQRDGAAGLLRLRRCDLPRKAGTAPPPPLHLQAVASRLGIP